MLKLRHECTSVQPLASTLAGLLHCRSVFANARRARRRAEAPAGVGARIEATEYMGGYDDITPEQLQADLRRFAEFLLRLEKQGRLLEATPRILKLLGELRSKIFAYEVRVTGRLAPREVEPPEVAEAQRIVDEAVRRALEAERGWSDSWDPEDEEGI